MFGTQEVPLCPVEAVVDCLLTVLNGERLVEQAFALVSSVQCVQFELTIDFVS